MIRTSCAWARVSSRRTANTLSRNSNTHTGARFPASPSHVVRRHHASHPPVGHKAPDSTKTIPGPSWLWLEPIYGPFRAYGRVQQRSPYRTQFISSLVIYFVGDLVAQSLTSSPKEEVVAQADEEVEERGWMQEWSDNRDWHRTGRALIIGGISSIPSYKWFLWLGNNFNYSSKILSLTTKVLVNQVFFTPLFNSYFFGMQTLLVGATLPEIIERIKNTVPTSWINSCKLWPAVTAFSFTYIPTQYRSIFGGVIAIGWQTYLSLLNQRAAAVEEVEHVAEHKASAPARIMERRQEREPDRQKCAV
ncbi:hypothetical protein P153DRAFT_366406 [Dothidotthia symphoricarpi CBS 119687]|uniref:Uncharacterized protein n=1 Tax=Dothidotthia symphoricarpi CBS 119687 TaxID=1392245 RepID=A0A6A6ADJ4_9PLEO|nr:uncharacterized protein P153DRAFT_366406 [Dothidotthia symphoricarpi CBS 119687]KAF2129909.1 hypothetical protein P153DRAFT_366406 [Dothidotthia symphoricarpi CBS 119687]